MAGQGRAVSPQRTLTDKGKLHGVGCKLGLSGDSFARHALRLQGELAAIGAGNGEALWCKTGNQKGKNHLGLVAVDAAVDGKRRVGKFGGIASGIGENGDIGASCFALHLDRGLGGVALSGSGEAHMQVERGKACELLRFGHALAKAKELARHFQSVGGHGLQREINLARRRLAHALDAATPVERDGAGRGKVEAIDIEGVLGEAEFGIEPPCRDVGEQKLSDAQLGMYLIITQRSEHAPVRHRRKVGLLRI